ncbi:hypothetical protein Taro_029775 [Colocasia esculenta]|uniref:Uncharacterized protein n=1 Tax=Colocasia esculenta TaxID=4460 RepID=A0A843VJS8_COLES|nr:hypothetical protein [Colocasia esculenta]
MGLREPALLMLYGGVSRLELGNGSEVMKLEISFMSIHRPSKGSVWWKMAISLAQKVAAAGFMKSGKYTFPGHTSPSRAANLAAKFFPESDRDDHGEQIRITSWRISFPLSHLGPV